MPEPEPFATKQDVVNAWRPLSTAEQSKAAYWLERASRMIRRLWPDVDERIAGEAVAAADVRDAVVDIVVTVLDRPANARQYTQFSRSSGAESISGTFRDDVAGGNGFVVVTQDLLDLLGTPITAVGAPVPLGVFPPAPRFDRIDQPRRAFAAGQVVVITP